MSTSIIAADFDRARQEMLAEFRRLIAVDSEAAAIEARATQDAMRQLFRLEAPHAVR